MFVPPISGTSLFAAAAVCLVAAVLVMRLRSSATSGLGLRAGCRIALHRGDEPAVPSWQRVDSTGDFPVA
ncbi:hypothetical protein [Roseateles sp. LKC17W]|uniref:hypothetical protein n=1 Tax=Pelomonas margarita TaxID=3299031 RepID=UPI00374A3A79